MGFALDHVFNVKSLDACRRLRLVNRKLICLPNTVATAGIDPGGKAGPGKDVCDEDSNATDGRALTGMHHYQCGLRVADLEPKSRRQSSPIDLSV